MEIHRTDIHLKSCKSNVFSRTSWTCKSTHNMCCGRRRLRQCRPHRECAINRKERKMEKFRSHTLCAFTRKDVMMEIRRPDL
eukprot:3926528-Heterocapsa_arctica.AAC.1